MSAQIIILAHARARRHIAELYRKAAEYRDAGDLASVHSCCEEARAVAELDLGEDTGWNDTDSAMDDALRWQPA